MLHFNENSPILQGTFYRKQEKAARKCLIARQQIERLCNTNIKRRKLTIYDQFDTIILDLYEGPFEAAKERGDYLYGETALAMSGSALMPGGVFAVWSEDPDKAFERRLVHAGFSFKRHRPGRGNRHVVYIAKKSGSSPSVVENNRSSIISSQRIP